MEQVQGPKDPDSNRHIGAATVAQRGSQYVPLINPHLTHLRQLQREAERVVQHEGVGP